MATLDNHVLAFDAQTGKVVWNKAIIPPGVGYAMTSAPLAIEGGKIVAGYCGGEYGVRGFVVALDAKTGAQLWKFYTVPSPGEPGGDTWKPGHVQNGGGGRRGSPAATTPRPRRSSGASAIPGRGSPTYARATTSTPTR